MNHDDARAPASRAGVEQLRALLEQATALVDQLQAERTAEPLASPEIDTLRQQVESLRGSGQELQQQLVSAERRLGRLMSLYVATYQLHSTLNVDNVLASIAEIAADLLGAASYVLLIRDGTATPEHYEIALSEAVPATSPFAGAHYTGGDATVDATLADGQLRLGEPTANQPVAAVPLTVQEQMVGALVVLELFAHKGQLAQSDRDLLDLLGAHAASALFVARHYESTDRKLKTLEGLVTLVRGK